MKCNLRNISLYGKKICSDLFDALIFITFYLLTSKTINVQHTQGGGNLTQAG